MRANESSLWGHNKCDPRPGHRTPPPGKHRLPGYCPYQPTRSDLDEPQCKIHVYKHSLVLTWTLLLNTRAFIHPAVESWMQGARSDGTILHPVPRDSPAQLLTLSTCRENQIPPVVAGQNHGFLCLLKPNRAYGDRVWRNRFNFFFLSRWRREHSRLMPWGLRLPPWRAYIKRGRAIGSWWWGMKVRGSWFLPFAHCFKDSHRLAPVAR